MGRPGNGNKDKEIELEEVESTIVPSVEDRLAALPNQLVAATIFKVPHTITIGQPEAYKPKFVAIGPFNHNRNFPDEHRTKTAETHKIWYLRDFLKRNNNPPSKFNGYVSGIRALEGKARNCYSEGIPLSSEELVEGMALDACFIIELFLKNVEDKDGIAEDDPIYGSLLIIHIAYDLLLLENQLPFFILEDVYKRFNTEEKSFQLTDLAMNFFNKLLRRKDAGVQVQSDSVHHLLHLVYLQFVNDQPLSPSELNFPCYCNFFLFHQKQKSPDDEDQQATQQVTIPSATVLHDAGVKFSKCKKNTNFLAITFNMSKGHLEIPAFFLDDSSDFFMRNLIAFEQCLPHVENPHYSFTLYAYFMDRLVNTEKDIEILSKSEIIQHALGSDEEAAVFFNKLCTGLAINFEKTHLGEICEHLNEYYRHTPNKWRAKFMHDYFSSPWSILSLVAALLLLALTLIQTTYSVLSYVKPK